MTRGRLPTPWGLLSPFGSAPDLWAGESWGWSVRYAGARVWRDGADGQVWHAAAMADGVEVARGSARVWRDDSQAVAEACAECRRRALRWASANPGESARVVSGIVTGRILGRP